jgi:guanylate kinase
MKEKGLYLVLSAPSGAGKTTIARKLVEKHRDMVISVSATTREKRPREKDQVDYYFLSEAEFNKNITDGNFIEYEEVHGNYYGTLKNIIEKLHAEGKSVVFDIDVKGAMSIKNKYPQAILIFINAPSKEELIERLRKRKSENEETIHQRLKRIEMEMTYAPKFDHIVINDSLEHTIQQIEEIIGRN